MISWIYAYLQIYQDIQIFASEICDNRVGFFLKEIKSLLFILKKLIYVLKIISINWLMSWKMKNKPLKN
jgi:hypothetical protein